MIYLASALMVAICAIAGFVTHQTVYFGLAIVMASAAATLAWVKHTMDKQTASSARKTETTT